MIKSTSFGITPEGREAKLYKLKRGKYTAYVTDFGATLVKFCGYHRSLR